MKRTVTLILSLILTLQLFSCTGNGEKAETDPSSSTLPAEYGSFDSWLSYGTLKVTGRTRAPRNEVKTATVLAAKNESESVQLSIRSEKELKGLTLSIRGEAEGVSTEIFEEYLITLGNAELPDPIVPLSAEFTVLPEKTKTFLIRFNVSEDAVSGDHSFYVDLKHGEAVLESYEISLSVMGYSLPEEYFTPVYTDVNMNQIKLKEKLPASKLKEYHRKYYDFLLDYGMTVKSLPYDILDDRADAYMSDPKVKAFSVDASLSDEELILVYEKLSSNPEWLEKAMVTVFDEPTTVEHLDEYIARASRIKELCPELDIHTAYFTNIKYDESRDTVDIIAEYTDDFCVKSCAWGDGWLADPLKKGNFAERIKALAGEDGSVLWYVCCDPKDPYCNLQIDENALNHRVLFWQQYFYDVDGLLYWNASYWRFVTDPWTDMATVKDISLECYGDGSLLYPGKAVGIDGPVASIRLDCIRDGLEDIALLKLAEREFGREWVIERVSTVTPSITEHTQSTDVFGSVRDEILKALNEKLG